MNTELRFTNRDGGAMCFVVNEVVGLGGTCIVYDGYYVNNTGYKNTVRIKECYPYKLHIERGDRGKLIIADKEKAKFEEYKKRVRTSFNVANELHETSGLTNLTSNVFDIYEANETVYIVSSYVEGSTLSDIAFDNLRDAVRAVLSTSKSIEKIHNKGYLYLDVKPENVLVYRETPDLIQLFDFDSMIPMKIEGDITEYRVSYSKGFAPVEQKTGSITKIGKYSDVYSVGALLFYLLFGRAPGVLDSGHDAKYDYNRIRWGDLFQDRLYKLLTEFFHNTLQTYYKDRYQEMGEAVLKLEEIEKYSSVTVPFIASSGFYLYNNYVIGREKECNELLNWYESDEKLIFVTGIGGVGKSTVVSKFINDNREKFDNVVYMKYKSSISETIGDDTEFFINGYEKTEEESYDEYFIRKLTKAKELAIGTETIIIIDNFIGRFDEHFYKLCEVGWKVIIITRMDVNGVTDLYNMSDKLSDNNYSHCIIKSFDNNEELRELFEINIQRKIKSNEWQSYEKLVELVRGHTLILVLIARQIFNSHLSISETLELIKENGLDDIAEEKINYVHDGNSIQDKLPGIIRIIYDTSLLSDEKKRCMKVISMFGSFGIDIKEAKDLLELATFDEINELKSLGWIQIENDNICMHQLVREAVSNIEWIDEYRKIAVKIMHQLAKTIQNYGNRHDFCRKMSDDIYKIDSISSSINNSNISFSSADLNDSLINRMIKKREKSKHGVQEKVKKIGTNNILRYKKLIKALAISKEVLLYCGKDGNIVSGNVYRELMFVTLLNLPKEEEEYIIKNAERFYFAHIDFQQIYDTMQLYDYVVYLLCEKKNYEKAREYLNGAYRFAKTKKDDYLWGLYYDMLGDFYDTLLNGAYYSDDEDENALYLKMMYSIDKNITYMKNSEQVCANVRYAKALISKAILMIRNSPEKVKIIRNLMAEAKTVIEEKTLGFDEIRSVYYMAHAWFNTLCKKEEKSVLHYLYKSYENNRKRDMSQLDEIDDFYIPAANMMCELGNTERACGFLQKALKICDAHKEVIPYIRKKHDLQGYEQEVYFIRASITKTDSIT